MISKIEISNFKCFEKQSFELENLTLLAGLNGMGKSSILQSLLLLRQSKSDGLLDRVGLSLNGELIELGTVKDIFFEGAVTDQFGFSMSVDDNLPVEWSFNYDRQSDVASQISPPVMKSIYQTSLFTDRFHYLQAERIGPRKSYAMSEYQVGQRHQLGPRGEFTAHYLSLYGSENISISSLVHPKASSLSLKDQVEAWMSEISPGVKVYSNALPELDLVNLRYAFVQRKEVSNSYRSTNVGFGISYALHILVAMLSSEPGYLVLIENPEAHLHPHGQVRMGELIALVAQAGVQVILETHSDHILNGVVSARTMEKFPLKMSPYIFLTEKMTDLLRYPHQRLIGMGVWTTGRKVFSMNGIRVWISY